MRLDSTAPSPANGGRPLTYSPPAVTGLDFVLAPSDDPDLAVVQLDGEIDLSNATELTERLAELASTSMLILDLNRVSFVDSAALHCLFRTARERGKSRLALVVDPSSPIFTTFEIVQLERAAPIVPQVEDAITRLRGA
jgi:anti-anti-sigma factor